MKRSVFVAFAAVAAAAAIGAGGAASANTFATVQTAGGTTYECSGTYVETLNSQTCTTAGNDVVCVLRTDLPEMTQTCNVTQASVTTPNRARIIQVAATNKGVPDQDHRQIVDVSQTNGSASNYVDVSQVIKQSLGPGHFDDTDESEPDSATTSSTTPIVTKQETHQLVNIVQSTTNGVLQAGNNTSGISQFAKQRARALHAPSITELQNTEEIVNCVGSDDQLANMCALVDQKSTNGQNISTLDDTYLQFMRAHKTIAGMQEQGIAFGVGGMNHEIHQESPSGLCKIVTKQAERQTMRAVQAGVMQSQHGPTRKGAGSNQACSPDSVWTGTQDSTQVATSRPTEHDIDSLVFASPAMQDNLLEYLGVSTGSIHATQSVTQQLNGNHAKKQNSCPSPESPSDQICAAVITCSAGETCVSSSDEDLVCPPETFPNPETGKCEGEIT